MHHGYGIKMHEAGQGGQKDPHVHMHVAVPVVKKSVSEASQSPVSLAVHVDGSNVHVLPSESDSVPPSAAVWSETTIAT